MTHVIITAGGTIEGIDGVRQITNTSTGRLSACVYDALADAAVSCGSELTVHYVVSERAVRPVAKESLPIVFHPVTDVKSVASTLKTLFDSYEIRFVIHGMAVSDFTKGYIIERDNLAKELAEAINKVISEKKPSFGELLEAIGDVLKAPAKPMDSETKVSSKAELMLSLVKTPKIIGKIKEWCPDTFLVGFKLLKGVSEEELVNVASELAEKNGCNLVLANDLTLIKGDRHPGLLIQSGKIVGRYETKEEIGKGIAGQIIKRLGGAL